LISGFRELIVGILWWEMRNAYKTFVGKSKGNRYAEVLGVDGRIILKWVSSGREYL
jgi:hypothetical protein